RLPQLELTLEDAKQSALDLDDALGRFELAAQRRLLNGSRDDVAGQRQISGLELKQLLLGDGIEVLDGAEIAAPDIRHKAYIERVGDQRIFGLRGRAEIAAEHRTCIAEQQLRGRRRARYLRQPDAAL